MKGGPDSIDCSGHHTAVIAFYFVGIYNNLVSLRNLYQNAYTQIDIQLKRRYDLIPNLVEAAKGYLAHERATLEAVIQARNTAFDASKAAAAAPGNAAAMAGLAQAEGSLAGLLSKLVAVVESYPDLKADATIRDLMEELTSTETKSLSSPAYNDAVTVYNTRRGAVPDNIVFPPSTFKRRLCSKRGKRPRASGAEKYRQLTRSADRPPIVRPTFRRQARLRKAAAADEFVYRRRARRRRRHHAGLSSGVYLFVGTQAYTLFNSGAAQGYRRGWRALPFSIAFFLFAAMVSS